MYHLAWFVSAAEALKRWEGGARGEDGPALGVGVSGLGGALRLAGRVGEREDDRLLVQSRHLLDHLPTNHSSVFGSATNHSSVFGSATNHSAVSGLLTNESSGSPLA